MTTTTSREAYRAHVIDGGAFTQRVRILNLLDESPCALNRRQIGQLLNIPINAVCGRVKCLIDSGLVRVAYCDLDQLTMKRVEYLRSVRELKQGELF